MTKIKLLCINSEGVFNITKGKEYETTQKLFNKGESMSKLVWITNDHGQLSYYDLDRFTFVFDNAVEE